MIKMIALDMDNTLLNSQKEISPRNEAVLKRLHEQGIKIVLCTGRPINAIWPYIEQLGLTTADDSTITFNGGLVVNNQTRAALSEHGISKDKLQAVFDFAKQHDFSLDVLDFDRVYEIMDMPRSIYKTILKNIEFKDAHFNDLPGGDHVYAKAIMAIPAAKMSQEVLPAVPDELRQRVNVVQSQPMVLEFLPNGVNKSVGLQALLEHYGWDFANLMTFGDADNDYEMIRDAGDGVVMANGLDSVKKAADHLTKSNNEDGVAVYLENFFATLM